jgi:hypothetical protein
MFSQQLQTPKYIMVMQQLRHVNVDKIIDFMDNFISIASAFINFYFESKVEIEGVK